MLTKKPIKIMVVFAVLTAVLAAPLLARRGGGRVGSRSSSGVSVSVGSRRSGFSFSYRQGTSRGMVGRRYSAPKHRSIIRPSPLRGVTRGNVTTMYQTPTSRRYYDRRPSRSNYRLNRPYRRYNYYRWPQRRYYNRRPYRRYYFYYGWPYVNYYYYGYPSASYNYYSYEYKSSDLDTAGKSELAQTNVDRHLDKISDAFMDGDYKAAVIRARSAVSDEPDSAALRFVYSQALLADGQYRKAASVLRGAMERTDPYIDGVFYNLGLYPDDDVLKQHIAKLRLDVESKPARGDLQLLLGYQLLSIGQYDQARIALEKAGDDQTNRIAGEKLTVILEKLTKTPKPESLEIPDKNDY